MMRGSTKEGNPLENIQVGFVTRTPYFKYQKESLLADKKIGRKEEISGAEEDIFREDEELIGREEEF